jgi:hypothetical protein
MARCVVKVIGMADRMKGTAKNTGKPYDMVECAFSFVNPWGNNSVCCSMIDGAVIDKMQVRTGARYDASVMTQSGKTYIDLFQEVK